MTDRGAVTSDRAPACPFVAFEDDRDERSDRPDHRHRCYAEIRPAPRAIAHQETYCLSPRFPTCPTFQDWARREAAQARNAAARGAGDAQAARGAGEAVAAVPEPEDAGVIGDPADDEGDAAPVPFGEAADDLAPRSRPHRDWAAPPPWVDPAVGPDGAPAEVPGAGLATSRWLADVRPGDDAVEADDPLVVAAKPGDPDFMGLAEAIPRPELAGIAARPRRPVRQVPDRSRRERPVVGQARPAGQPERPRDRAEISAPAWEQPRRFEAYPSIRSRMSMPSVPRVALGAIALLVAAVLLFTLPALFLTKNGPAAVGSPSPSPSPSASVAPTPTPPPTPLTYTVKAGDTLIKIATKFKVTQKAILAANPSLKNANLIAIGQVLIIPTPPPPDVIKSSPGASASPSGSTAP